MELHPGLLVAGRFKLIRPLGQGGMGAVWLGQQVALDTPCALKFIHEQAAQSPELRARFEREAKAAAQLRSPHVVNILDHGMWEGAPYIAMELLEGEDLEARLNRQGSLAPQETLAIVTQVGRALSKAHAVGLIHRDLKPANIFLTRDEDREIAKVLDFGVAKVKETVDGSTKTGAVLGTPYYMSPEQARGSKAIDHRSDLWALAVVTYQCVTGKLPFDGEALGDLFMKIMAEPLPIPSQCARVPATFDAWWNRAAARDPAHRFQTAKEFNDALSLALGVTVMAGTDLGHALTVPGAMTTPSQPVASPYPSSGGPSSPGLVLLGPTAPAEWGGRASSPGVGPTTGAGFTPMQQSMNVTGAAPTKRGGVVVLAVIGGLAVLGGGAFFALRGGSSATAASAPVETAQPTAPAPTATAAATASSSAEAAPTESAAPAAPSAAATAEPAATAQAHADAPKPAHPRAAKPTAPSAPTAAPASKPGKPNCNPPFTIDAGGTKHAKPECF